MVTLRDGKVLEEVDINSKLKASPREVNNKNGNSSTLGKPRSAQKEKSKKRKSLSEDENSEGATRKKQERPTPDRQKKTIEPETSTPIDVSLGRYTRDHIDREHTPGREGPIKEDDDDCEPDIKPFKGEKGHKVRKTPCEKEEEYQQFAFENEGHTFHELYVCHRKGPKGSPTYDKSGFQLDWKKVDAWMAPKAYNKGAMVHGMERTLDKGRKEAEEMAKLFFVEGEAPDEPDFGNGKDVWRERVSQDLDIPWHRIGVEEFEKWDRMGFKKARRGEYEKFDEAGQKRFMCLLDGASLRK